MACFYVTISESFEHFQAFKQIFWKTKTFFEKLKYRLLVDTKIGNTSFPFKSSLSDASVKTNRKRDYKMDLSQRVEFCQ